MEQNLDKDSQLRNKFEFFFKKNRFKIITLIFLILIVIFIFFFIKISNEKKQNLISEKYIQAGLYLAKKESQNSLNLYKEIIRSKNKFYSVLSLYTIIEKNLEKDEKKIFEYFEIIEGINLSKNQKDLVKFKKALYLIDKSYFDEGEKLLNLIIKSNSNYKSIAQTIIDQKNQEK